MASVARLPQAAIRPASIMVAIRTFVSFFEDNRPVLYHSS
jgi:hypothetical protein